MGDHDSHYLGHDESVGGVFERSVLFGVDRLQEHHQGVSLIFHHLGHILHVSSHLRIKPEDQGRQ